MDLDLYDEFGNYIGPDLEEEEEEEHVFDHVDADFLPELEDQNNMDMDHMNQIVLHEDKNYYPSARDIYGDDVEALVQDEDTQLLTEPIIAPPKEPKRMIQESKLPETTYRKQYLADLLEFPELVRNVAVIGHLHHGKTSLLDTLISETHNSLKTKYCDVHPIEVSRGISIKSMPMSLILADLREKSHVINFIDTPGHVNFCDEAAAAIRVADGALLVVDVIEGVMMQTERLIKYCVEEGLPMVLLINKIDRLILELKLPPADAYFKIKYCIQEVNSVVAKYSKTRFSPELGNVCFASTKNQWIFSLRSFAKMYSEAFESFDYEKFATKLWGDWSFDPVKRTFATKGKKSFVHFILEPIYKIYTQVVAEDTETLKKTLQSIGIFLKSSDYSLNIDPLLNLVCAKFFGASRGLVDMLVNQLPNPFDRAPALAATLYTGDQTDLVAESIAMMNKDGPLVVNIVKLYNSENVSKFSAFGRVLSGTLRVGDTVRVLGESYSLLDEEDMSVQQVSSISIYESRYQIPIEAAYPGSLVLVGGIDSSIQKTATVTDMNSECSILKPLRFMNSAVFKVAIEPVNPSDLPKMLDGLRKVNKSYPLLQTRVEESGEHVVLGTGELYMDSVLYDLRLLYSEIDIKVSDPVVKFSETCIETSTLKCFAETPNRKSKLTMIAEPLEKQIATDIQDRKISLKAPTKQVSDWFSTNYKWDVLASRSIWAFGPDEFGPNILLNDTLPQETDRALLNAVKPSIIQGFQWGTREGPLADEPMRNVKFRVLEASIAQEPVFRGGGQIIPTSRRVCYSSFLMATPRIMEPVYSVEIQCPADCVSVVYDLLAKRRGHVVQDIPKPGSPLYTVKALLPVIDSCGFETDLRTHTLGQAFCQQVFDHWQVVPGDPLDKSIVLRPLEPSPAPHLAREFMIKTRRRKGLSEDVVVSKFFDDSMLIELAKLDSGLFL